MKTINITLTESGKYKESKLPKGETKSGNVVYQVINIPDDMVMREVMKNLRIISLAKVVNYVIDFSANRRSL